MMYVEEQWEKTLKETRVSSSGAFWGRVAIGLVVGGIAVWMVKPYALVLAVVTLFGCVYAFVNRRRKMAVRDELVDFLMTTISDDMEARELGVVLWTLSDLGPGAARALPWIEEIEKANAGSPEIVEVCVMARARIAGNEVLRKS